MRIGEKVCTYEPWWWY